MKYWLLLLSLMAGSCAAVAAQAQSLNSCADLADLKIDHVEITKAAPVPAGLVIPPPYPDVRSSGPLPAHCRVDGVINRRKGVDGEEFGITFAWPSPQRTHGMATS